MDWNIQSECTICIWNTHDKIVILFVPYICVPDTEQSFYLLIPVIYFWQLHIQMRSIFPLLSKYFKRTIDLNFLSVGLTLTHLSDMKSSP